MNRKKIGESHESLLFVMKEKKLKLYVYRLSDNFSLSLSINDTDIRKKSSGVCVIGKIKSPGKINRLVLLTTKLESWNLIFNKLIYYQRPIVPFKYLNEIEVTWKKKSKNTDHKLHTAFGDKNLGIIAHYSESIIEKLNEKDLL